MGAFLHFFLFINLIDIVDFIYSCNLVIDIFFRVQNYFGNVFIDRFIIIWFYLKVIKIKDAGHLEICCFRLVLIPIIDRFLKVTVSQFFSLRLNPSAPNAPMNRLV